MALHTAQTVPEIAISRVRKSQDEITGKRAREGKEGGGGIQNSEDRIQKTEIRRQELSSVNA
jgi:hypothetical protein